MVSKKEQLEREVLFKASLEIIVRIDGSLLFQSHIVKTSFDSVGYHLF